MENNMPVFIAIQVIRIVVVVVAVTAINKRLKDIDSQIDNIEEKI